MPNPALKIKGKDIPLTGRSSGSSDWDAAVAVDMGVGVAVAAAVGVAVAVGAGVGVPLPPDAATFTLPGVMIIITFTPSLDAEAEVAGSKLI